MELQKHSKPKVVSQLSAKRQADLWTELNVVDTIMDGDGLKWKLRITVQDVIEHRAERLPWKATVEVKTEATAADFVATGTLDAQKDARLIQLLGTHVVPLILKPLVFQATSGEEGKRMVSLRLVQIRNKFAAQKLFDFKRRCIGRWIDEQRRFDKPVSSPNSTLQWD